MKMKQILEEIQKISQEITKAADIHLTFKDCDDLELINHCKSNNITLFEPDTILNYYWCSWYYGNNILVTIRSKEKKVKLTFI